jgi:glycosyltransferase involved in cell wall biosynthesis
VGIVSIRAIDLGTYTGDTNKLFEYLMAGLPVAASDLPEIRRVLTAGDPPPGELFDAEDPESIALAIGRLLADEDVYAARRHEARRLALERYNWTVQEPRLVEVYRDALTNEPRRRRKASHRPL